MRPDRARCGILNLAELISRLSKFGITDMPLNLAPSLAKRGPGTPFTAWPCAAGEDTTSIACNVLDAAR